MCDKCYDCDTSIEHRIIPVGCLKYPSEKLMTECKNAHLQTDLKNICERKNMNFYKIHFKPLYQTNCCGYLIDIIEDAHTCVPNDNDIETNLNLKHSLKNFFD